MQDINSIICGQTSTSDTLIYFQKDRRLNVPTTDPEATDSYSYRIKKLGNHCWMTQNLALQGGVRITTTYSNVTSDDFTLPEVAWTNSNTVAQLHSNNNSHIDNTIDNSSNTGVFYNWCAATAGTCTNINEQSYANTMNDICPKNWHLPSFNSRGTSSVGSGEWFELIGRTQSVFEKTWATTSTWGDMAYFENGWVGWWDNNKISQGGRGAYYWSSTNSQRADRASCIDSTTTASNAAIWNDAPRYVGISIRCVAK